MKALFKASSDAVSPLDKSLFFSLPALWRRVELGVDIVGTEGGYWPALDGKPVAWTQSRAVEGRAGGVEDIKRQ